MTLDKKIVREMIIDFLRLMNKFNKLSKQTFDFGTGDVLYPAEVHVIDEIGKKNGETVTGLCKLFGVTKGAVSQIVGKLSRKGYVKKVRNENYGKEIILSLTPKGKKAFDAHIQLHDAIDKDFVRALGDIPPKQVEQFTDILKRIENHVDVYINLRG
ncbi:MAG: MarR family winged helix-turn-helix transcriptional regulator [Smithellaceae bacterium]